MSYELLTDSKSSIMNEDIVIIYNSCTERCCCKKYKITEDQRSFLNILRSRCRVPFNKENLIHNDLLKQLWKINFPDYEFPIDGKSEKWKEIGFQGKDPSSDFRGAGLFGLEQLIFLALNYPSEYIAMRQGAKNYSFAISALNITVKNMQHLLMNFFQLHKKNAVGVPGSKNLGIKHLCVFCRLNEISLDTINELYVAAVIKMHDTWVEMNKVARVNVMQFNNALIVAGEFVQGLLDKNPDNIAELKKLAFA